MTVEIQIVDTAADFEHCRAIRMTVFVEEQAVPAELEMDDLDAVATHLLATVDGRPAGTARIVDKGASVKIGRVAVLKEHRGGGVGRLIMEFAIDEARRRGYSEVVLSSQTYVIPFYERLGFVAEGPEYDDAGIPHRTMRFALKTPSSLS